ncbi:MAG: linear amide C-N hydrolase [Melioribacteraceae bacterium]|nr:linear amide C-N hydrolase [Melioribacteraceae bacterium]
MKWRITILSFLFSTFIIGQQFNCTSFVYKNGIVYLAKNLDWAIGNGLILFNKSGKVKKSIYSKGENKSWISRYSSITFNHFGLNNPLGGMNEKGLTVEELSTWPVDYPFNENQLVLSEFEWIQYQLDSYSTVAEVITKIDSISVKEFYFDIHYIIADSSGDVAVIEFMDGNPIIYRGVRLPHSILTNNNYSDLTKYIKLRPEANIHKLEVNSSQDRFLKTIELIDSYHSGKEKKSELGIMNILDSVKVADTKWSIVYNLSAKKISFRIAPNFEIRKIDFPIEQFSENKYVPINSEASFEFRAFSGKENIEYLKNLQIDLLNNKEFDADDLADKLNLLIDNSEK